MTKIYVKLIAMALALILSVSVVIMSSYAWMVLSGSPAVSGIQVAIGGGNTILIAPNVTKDGYNIPGHFSDKMNFGTQDSYSYLADIGGLSPVSTSNGIDWFLSEEKTDSFLEYANLSGDDEKIREGSYIFLDFWVVSPSGDYTLRICTGDEDSGGSFVIDLQDVEKLADGNGYTLSKPESVASSAVRIGFLTNDTQLTDDSMLVYSKTYQYDKRFTALKGWYQEKGTQTVLYLPNDRFIIYEPNGDYHPAKTELNGSYVKTVPMSTNENYNIWSNLAVQLSNGWLLSQTGTGATAIEEKFQTFLRGYSTEGKTEAEIKAAFYANLQGQISPYVEKGDFIKYSANLGTHLSQNDTVSSEALLTEDKAGAAEDVFIIDLEQNVPQRIRMFVWIEATDIDCEAIEGTASFAVNIELAGGSKK